MPTGRVKVFHEDRSFGFVTAPDGRDIFVRKEVVEDPPLHSGDIVDFEFDHDDGGKVRATTVKVTKRAPDDNPVGRTMSPPPDWDELEELDRQRRQARRRRR